MAIEIAVSLARCVFSLIAAETLPKPLDFCGHALAENGDIPRILGFLIFQQSTRPCFDRLAGRVFCCL